MGFCHFQSSILFAHNTNNYRYTAVTERGNSSRFRNVGHAIRNDKQIGDIFIVFFCVLLILLILSLHLRTSFSISAYHDVSLKSILILVKFTPFFLHNFCPFIFFLTKYNFSITINLVSFYSFCSFIHFVSSFHVDLSI